MSKEKQSEFKPYHHPAGGWGGGRSHGKSVDGAECSRQGIARASGHEPAGGL